MAEIREGGKSILGENIRRLVHQRSALDPDFTIEKFCKNLGINKVTYYNIIDGKTKKVDYFLLQEMAKMLNVELQELTGYQIPGETISHQETQLESSTLRKTKLLIPKVEPGYNGNKEFLAKYLIEYVELDIGNFRGASFCIQMKEVSPEIKEKFQLNPGDEIFVRMQDSSLPGKLIYLLDENNASHFEEYNNQQNIIGQVVFIRRYM